MVGALGNRVSHQSWFITASGLRDAVTRMDVVAHNVANSNTPGYSPTRAHSEALPQGGVTTRVEAGDPTSNPFSEVDLATEGLNMLLAKTAYQANARLLRTASETSRALFA